MQRTAFDCDLCGAKDMRYTVHIPIIMDNDGNYGSMYFCGVCSCKVYELSMARICIDLEAAEEFRRRIQELKTFKQNLEFLE